MQLLEDVYDSIRGDPAFDLLRAGKQKLVPGEGDEQSPRAFILGEAPGATEQMQLRPFVGRSGRLLRELMAVAGLSADSRLVWRSRTDIDGYHNEPNVWLTNVIKYRPHSNRDPIHMEMQASRKHIRAEWEAVNRPPVVICAGRIAAYTIGLPPTLIGKRAEPLRGTITGVWIWHMWHPSYVLREYNAIKKKHGEFKAESYKQSIEDDWHKLAEWMSAKSF